jgi:aryl-alcohol dehydrogenase-like predicted oxidoreductase
MVFIHSDGRDMRQLHDAGCIDALTRLRKSGLIRAIGLSGKTPAEAEAALSWADVLMVEYHSADTSHDAVMRRALERGIGIVVKKVLVSGGQPSLEIPFALAHPAVASVLIASLNLAHVRDNIHQAESSYAEPFPRS